jgi:hypothetical protein
VTLANGLQARSRFVAGAAGFSVEPGSSGGLGVVGADAEETRRGTPVRHPGWPRR